MNVTYSNTNARGVTDNLYGREAESFGNNILMCVKFTPQTCVPTQTPQRPPNPGQPYYLTRLSTLSHSHP